MMCYLDFHQVLEAAAAVAHLGDVCQRALDVEGEMQKQKPEEKGTVSAPEHFQPKGEDSGRRSPLQHEEAIRGSWQCGRLQSQHIPASLTSAFKRGL